MWNVWNLNQTMFCLSDGETCTSCYGTCTNISMRDWTDWSNLNIACIDKIILYIMCMVSSKNKFLYKKTNKLEALRERRPPWPRQVITPILPTVKMLSLGCERLPTPLKKKKKKKKKKVLGHYLHHDLDMLPLLRCIFAHLLILQYPDHHQNLISFSLYYSKPVHKISSQSVHNFLSNVVHRQTNRQTNQRYQKHNLLCQGGNKQKKIHENPPSGFWDSVLATKI